MWVADMDFKSSPAIIEALHKRVEHGIFGYARPVRSTVDAVVNAFEARYRWKIDPAWLVWLPGLVVGLNVTANAFCAPGEEVISFTPVYPPFMLAPKFQGRVSVPVPMVLEAGPSGTQASGRWVIDFDALERATTPKTKLLYLCHPHNPIARVWERAELVRLAEYCVRHGIVLCSDEIHCDLILDSSHRHIPVALGGVPGLKLVTLMAPSKTYNVPGLGTSVAIISDPALRTRFVQASAGIVAEVTSLGFAACEAAYRDSEPWRQALLAYLRGNRDTLLAFVARELPGVKIEAPIEATYLAWLNVEALGQKQPVAVFETQGVGLSDGAMFGAAPGRYVRLNFACPRATLDLALQRMKRAVSSLGP